MKCKKFIPLLCVLVLLLSQGGCFLDPAENLYAVPKQPESFYNLQSAIDAVMGDSATYSAPVSGENQQAVQTADLDGDGDDEAIVYINNGGDTPLCLCVFDRQDDCYSLLGKIEGVGSAFDKVEYLQFDGESGSEILVGRRLSDSVMQLLSVYSVRDGELVELLNAQYDEFITTDLDGDGLRDIILLSQDADATNGVAVYYHWSDGQPVRELEADLSAPVSSVKRIITGKMCRDTKAVFVASNYEEGLIVTDIFGLRDGTFTNFSRSAEVQTVREYYVYSNDIDADGLIELPRLIDLPSLEGDESTVGQSLILWYNLLLSGREEQKCLTYHNYSGGWYLSIPEDWADTLAVGRITALGSASGYRFVEISSGEEIFRIVATSSDDAAKNIAEEGWTQLQQKGGITYAFRLGSAAERFDLDEATLRSMFHLIRVDWKTGET